jgi:hypothetical protein
MKLYKYILLLSLSNLSLGLFSCKKIVEVGAPKNQVITPVVFGDSVNATSAILGMYTTLINNSSLLRFGNGAITLFTGLSGDELTTSISSGSEIDFLNNSLAKDNSLNHDALWRNAYITLYQVNACIEGLKASRGISTSLKNQLTGECKLTRAFIFFNLVNLYGGVPLVTTTDYQINARLPRSTVALVYGQVISDLVDAKQLLSEEYVSPGRFRPNKLTATAFLARVYLYQGQWNHAEQEASEVIQSNVYSLLPELNNIFLTGSNEAIWQLPVMQEGYATAEGNRFVPGSSSTTPQNPVTDALLLSFEPNDKRKENWLNHNVVGSRVFYYPYKYKLALAGSPDESYMLFRFSEQLLIRSEARIQQNKISPATEDLNLVRHRAGLDNTPATDQSSLLSALQQERRTELFCEWGHRWFDLNRTRQADAVLVPLKGSNWQSTDKLYPIPFQEIRLNSLLVQNDGY